MRKIAQVTMHAVSVPLKQTLWTAQATPIPLAHGERELTRFTVRDFITSGAIRYVQFDSTRAAGFTERAQVRDGHVYLNDKPGFGVEINREFVKRYRA